MTLLSTEEFVSQFFSHPNIAWPNMDPHHSVAATIGTFLPALATQGECPLVLPRRDIAGKTTALYVICWDTAHAGRVRALLEAAIAHNWCRFDGRVARLDRADTVDAAVLRLVGPGTTYVIRPNAATARPTLIALQRLASTIGDLPLRRPALARPIGRMLREFELALASGAVEASASLLQEVELFGGVSHDNVAFLQIRRLAQLGRDRELLAHGSLPSLVYAEPPRMVREAVISAWVRVNLELPIASKSVDTAVAALGGTQPDVAMLVDESLVTSTEPGVGTFCALVALAREDARLASRLQLNVAIEHSVIERLKSFSEQAAPPAEPPVRDEQGTSGAAETAATEEHLESANAADAITDERPAESWLEWVAQLSGARTPVLDEDLVNAWAPAWSVDSELAAAIEALPSIATDDLLAGVAFLLETDDTERPASRTAASMLGQYLVAERFTPYDLAAICALLEIFLRGAPSATLYESLLDDIRAFAPQWVAVGVAARVLDIADAVARGPLISAEARADFVATLLGPLNQAKHRLTAPVRSLASLVTGDVGLDYDWAVSTIEVGAGPQTRNDRVLIYSLDTGTLARVTKAIEKEWPGIRVYASSDKDGSPALKQQARHAHLIVLATRRATHAATGFITDNSHRALIRFADGSGSASMLRAVESGLAELVG